MNLMNTKSIFGAIAVLTAGSCGSPQQEEQEQPNIIYILADDMGYGDVSCYNENPKIKTPHIDKLASEGVRFTDAHSTSSVSTPSRYSMLTGRYNWRTRLQSGVLMGFDPPLITPPTYTVAQLLKDNGYQTACIGKWHLGMNWTDSTGLPITSGDKFKKVDYTGPIENGPLSAGFDYFFGIAASLDMPPYLYIENDKATKSPTVIKKQEGQRRVVDPWWREGHGTEDFEAEDVLSELAKKSRDFISRSATSPNPFFLYLALPSPHTPIVPSSEFKGKSGVTAYGDFVMETDWVVGRVMQILDSLKLTDNTLVVVTSDNGFAPYVLDYYNVEERGHYPSWHFRGYKSDAWEGGHHVPFVVRWPGKVQPGTVNNHLIGQVDFMATCADITGQKLPTDQGVDSYSFLPTLLNPKAKTRPDLVYHSIAGFFAIRKGDWKLILCPGSGGWSNPTNAEAAGKGLPEVQLYNIANDIQEKNNVEKDHPEIVKELTALLEKYIKEGRSTSGPVQSNDVEVDMWKKSVY